MSATRTAYALLALNAGGIWACFCALLAVHAQHRLDGAEPPTVLWPAEAVAPEPLTALVPLSAAQDPWEGAPTVVAELPAPGPLPPVLPWDAAGWAGPTRVLPRLESRRVIQLPPPSPSEATGLFVELILTRRLSPSAC